MTNETLILITTAASIGFFHTLFGPDHYLPFVMMAKARQWTHFKTAWVTVVCGLGHVLSSVFLGTVGIVFAVAVFKLEAIESLRGDFAGWMLIIFGLSYFIWGIHKLYRGKVAHSHLFGSHKHHYHDHDHSHIEDKSHGKKETTPWILFLIFVLGPCEPLIPLLMYPAARNSVSTIVYVTAVFGIITITTMLSIVMLSVWGISKIRFSAMEKYMHPVSGLAILGCGIAIMFLGL
jgi:nickel/cobalt transporter (NicO) family protein